MKAFALGSLLSALLLSGCGGGGSGTSSPSGSLTLSPEAGFNGTSAALRGVASGTASGTTTVTVREGGRKIVLALPASLLEAGRDFEVASSFASATYIEDGGRAWRARGGRISVVRAGQGAVALDLFDVVFDPDASVGGNGAAGSFTLAGRLERVPVAVVSGGSETRISLGGFSNANVDASPFPVNANLDYFTSSAFARISAQAGTRFLRLEVDGAITIGASIDFSVLSPTNLQLWQGGPYGRQWQAVSGTAFFTAYGPKAWRVVFKNVRMEPISTLTNPATGSFVINGSITVANPD